MTDDPNPSVITCDAIDRRVASIAEVISARIDGIEKSQNDFRSDLVRVPTVLDRAIMSLRELLEARMTGAASLNEQRFNTLRETGDNILRLWDQRQKVLDERFENRDQRLEESLRRAKEAVDGALEAYRESMNKTESSFTKSLDNVQALLGTVSRATDDKIGDLKDRVTAMESRNNENRTVTTDSSTRMLAVIAIVVAASVGFGNIILQQMKPTHTEVTARP